ncbi:MAG: redoxin domain-containing protein [Acidimicrobiia bacterium]
MPLPAGTPAPDFSLRNQHLEVVSLSDFEGSKALLVFIPFAFTRVCGSELCQIRDNATAIERARARVVAITCNTPHANAAWALENDFDFDILSDFWPHGAVSRLYDTFDDRLGYAARTTYVLDPKGTIREVIASPELGTARPFERYLPALRAL